MFTTAQHYYLYIAVILYVLSFGILMTSFKRAGLALLGAGFTVQLLYLLGRGWLSGIFVPNPIFEGPFLLPVCIGAIVLLLIISGQRRNTGREGLVPLVILFSLFSIYYVKGMNPPTPKKTTIWAYIFFLTESGAHALFYCGAAAALLDLMKGEKNRLYSQLIVWGFVIFSISQVTGAVWCYIGWGNTFRWGPRHLATAAIWMFYASFIHMKYTGFFNENRRRVMAFLGALIVIAGSFGHYMAEMTHPRIGG